MLTLKRVSALLTGLMAGFDTFFLLAVNREYKILSGSEYTRVHQDMMKVAQFIAPLVGSLGLLANALLLLQTRRGAEWRTFAWVLVSMLCLMLNWVVTLTINVPINTKFRDASAKSPPEGWETLRDRWAVAHTVRSTIQLLGFAALLTGLIEERNSDSREE
jgi:uncharacterized membrane protein